MLVKDIMTRHPRTIMPETCIAEAMALMRFYQVDALPVTVNRQLVGFLQLRDVLAMFFPDKTFKQRSRSDLDVRRLQNRFAPLVRVAVKKLIVKSSRSVMPNVPVSEAMDVMLDENVNRLPVIEDDRLVGMISLDDVNKAIPGLPVPESRHERRSLISDAFRA